MKNNLKSAQKSGSPVSSFASALNFSALITVIFLTSIGDPFNSPKFWLLLTLCAWLLGYLILQTKKLWSNYRFFLLISIAYAGLLIVSSVASHDVTTSLFGENLRKDGAFTYIALVFIWLNLIVNSSLSFFKKYFNVILFVSIIVTAYGILQTNGKDFVSWNNPYNNIIGTLGNPNFASALFAILSSSIVIRIFDKNYSLTKKFSSLSLVLLMIYCVLQSKSRQGVIAFLAGVGVGICIILYSYRKSFGLIFSGLFFAGGIGSILGMLQIGPLSSVLYKESVSVRGFYWRAAIEMFKDHPFFGVGVDLYGQYFKQYREAAYPVKYGFRLTSTNAHSVPLQFFSTGGIFVGFLYLLIVSLTIFYSVKAIKNHKDFNQRVWISSLISAWVAYQAQSLISIDSIGLAIWGWILSAILISIGFHSDKNRDSEVGKTELRNPNMFLKQRLLSSTFVLILIIPISILYRGERAVYLMNTAADRKIYIEQVWDMPLQDSAYKFQAATLLFEMEARDEATVKLERLAQQNNRNQDALNALALIAESKNLLDKALIYRNRIQEIDPFNAENLKFIVKIYDAKGDVEKRNTFIQKILSFAANTDIGKEVKQQYKQ